MFLMIILWIYIITVDFWSLAPFLSSPLSPPGGWQGHRESDPHSRPVHCYNPTRLFSRGLDSRCLPGDNSIGMSRWDGVEGKLSNLLQGNQGRRETCSLLAHVHKFFSYKIVCWYLFSHSSQDLLPKYCYFLLLVIEFTCGISCHKLDASLSKPLCMRSVQCSL